MTPGNYDLTIYCGTTLDAEELAFEWAIDSVPVDFSLGWSARARGKTARGEVVFSWSTGDGTLVFGSTLGTVHPNVSAESTSAIWRTGLPPSREVGGKMLYAAGTWDLELVAPSGKVYRLLQGALYLSPEDS